MNRKYFYYSNTTAGKQMEDTAIPIFYSAKHITSASGAPVSGWANSGASGAAYDLQNWYGQPSYHQSADNQPDYLLFDNTPLISSIDVPQGITGNNDRTIGIYFNTETNFKNIIGYGTETNGGLFDILAYGDQYLTPHAYGPQIDSNIPVLIGQWQLIEMRVTNGLIEVFHNAALITIAGFSFTTATSRLIIGGGIFASYNTNGITKIASVYIADKSLSDAEMQVMRNRMN